MYHDQLADCYQKIYTGVMLPLTLMLIHLSNLKTVLTSSTSSMMDPPNFFLSKSIHEGCSSSRYIGEGTASLGVSVLPSVVEHLYDELDGVHKQSLMMISARGIASHNVG